MRPTLLTQRLSAGWLGVALIAAFLPILVWPWIAAGFVFGLALLVDLLGLRKRPTVRVERELSDSVAVGVWSEVKLTLHNEGDEETTASVFDHAPLAAEVLDLPHTVVIPAGGFARFSYRTRPRTRGPSQFGRTELLRSSTYKLWHARDWACEEHSLRVYPNFAPVVRYSLLALENRASQMGIRRKPRRGSGMDFHQLREYREGDRLQQIDWKATSRRRTLISREYQEERDQNVLFLVDSGRRMRSMDGELSHFDHCLNAILLLTYIALRQGDSVGVLGFGGSDRWVPPTKGSGGLTTILNGIYDYQPTTAPSDYLEAARRTIALQRRRALVILLTNLRGEDSADLEPAIQILRKRHLVVVVSLREQSIDAMLDTAIDGLAEALEVSAAELYLDSRAQVIERLRSNRVHALDVTAKELPIALANQYLDIKRAGAL